MSFTYFFKRQKNNSEQSAKESSLNSIFTQLPKKECMGCGACMSACPVGAMHLQVDKLGYYRSEIDFDKCVGCGRCAQVCPSLHLPEKSNSPTPDCFAFIASDEQTLYNSSSGGVFPLLAEVAFQKNGRVVGAAWREDFSVAHIIVDSKEDLHKLQKSKYLQSYLGNTFYRIKELLDKDVFALFSGCPCQVTGLKSYLGKDYENLILVDLLCSNAPSAMFFQKYIADSFPGGIEGYSFRQKVQGWNVDCVTLSVTLPGGDKQVRRGGAEDAYQRVYHNHIMCPPHCEKCKYQSVPRYGDITIGDFWGISKKDSQFSSKDSVSVVLCNNEKGRRFFDSIPDAAVRVKKEVPLQWLGGNGYAINGSHNYCSPHRDEFYKAIQTMPFQQAANYALKPNHGEYPCASDGVAHEINFTAESMHFKFDSTFWDEKTIKGMRYLKVRPDMSKPGRFATLSLNQLLDENKEYSFAIRFRAKTNSKVMNFHIKDSGTNLYQVIYSYRFKDGYNPEAWIEINSKFRPKSNIFDEFMIAASLINGSGNYICIDYINIGQI